MPYGTSGAIMPLYSPAGMLGCPGPGGSPGRLGGVPPAALASSTGADDCPGVPPQSLSISPIGTCRFCCKCRPKKYSTAENPFAEAGEHTCHVPTTSSAG